MIGRIPSLKALHAFEAAARHNSMSKATFELSVTPGAIGHQVKFLERSLGVQLFHRNIRKISLTQAGRSLFGVTRRVFDELEEEVRSLTQPRQEDVLTVGVSTFFATRWLSQRLGHFFNTHPEITVLLRHSVNDPDFASDEVDLAIRWGKGAWDSCKSEVLIAVPLVVACAPALAINQGGTLALEDIYDHVLLCDQPVADDWDDWLLASGLDPTRAKNRRLIIDANVRLQAAVDGQGLVLTNLPLVKRESSKGNLVQPLEGQIEDMGYHILHREDRQLSRSAQLFKEWIKSQALTFASEEM